MIKAWSGDKEIISDKKTTFQKLIEYIYENNSVKLSLVNINPTNFKIFGLGRGKFKYNIKVLYGNRCIDNIDVRGFAQDIAAFILNYKHLNRFKRLNFEINKCLD